MKLEEAVAYAIALEKAILQPATRTVSA
jgi:hypothetical protein